MRPTLARLGAALLGLALPALALSPAQARPAECLMTVQGKTYIQGSCTFEADPDGSFRLLGQRFFAYVTVTAPGVAEASWNGTVAASHAQEPLGEVRRNGACWQSATARLCAWAPGTRPRP
jgi:hypothetical protein